MQFSRRAQCALHRLHKNAVDTLVEAQLFLQLGRQDTLAGKAQFQIVPLCEAVVGSARKIAQTEILASSDLGTQRGGVG